MGGDAGHPAHRFGAGGGLVDNGIDLFDGMRRIRRRRRIAPTCPARPVERDGRSGIGMEARNR
jgi:hypothetical protein